MKRYLKKIGLIGGISMLLASCSTQTPPLGEHFLPVDDVAWQQHLAKLQTIGAYQARGQLGVLTEKSRFSASFEWQYANTDNYQLTFSGMLNLASLTLNMTSQGLSLQDTKGNIYFGQQAQSWLDTQLGFLVDLSQLAKWLKGIPPKGAYFVGENHLLHHFTYATPHQLWTVTYTRYDDSLAVPMPTEILLQSGKNRLKIRIKEWQW